MDTILADMQETSCLVYFHDIITGRSFEKHPQKLGAVLERLRQANLKVNSAKCNFFL